MRHNAKDEVPCPPHSKGPQEGGVATHWGPQQRWRSATMWGGGATMRRGGGRCNLQNRHRLDDKKKNKAFWSSRLGEDLHKQKKNEEEKLRANKKQRNQSDDPAESFRVFPKQSGGFSRVLWNARQQSGREAPGRAQRGAGKTRFSDNC